MSADSPFSAQNLDYYLNELSKVFRKLNGKKIPAEIILVGGASILADYEFRKTTNDVDAVIMASSVMKDAVGIIRDKYKLPNDWMNEDFRGTKSYSSKLREVSVYHKTFSDILTVRKITSEYLIAMKLMAGRKYKNDMSDIIGILWKHEENKKPITIEKIKNAVVSLYGDWNKIPKDSVNFINTAFEQKDYKELYTKVRKDEEETRIVLSEIDKQYPKLLNKNNIDIILEIAKKKKIDNPNNSSINIPKIEPISCTKHEHVEDKRFKDLVSIPVKKEKTFIDTETRYVEASKYNNKGYENIILEDCKKKSSDSTGKYTNDIFHIDKVPLNALSVEVFTKQFEQHKKEKTQKTTPKMKIKKS